MSTTNARLSLGFSCIGHTYSHLFGPIFYVAALSLEKDLELTHGGVVILIVAGNVLFGLPRGAGADQGDSDCGGSPCRMAQSVTHSAGSSAVGAASTASTAGAPPA